MTESMAKIVINDVFKDMTHENDRLLRELRFSLRSNELMEKYRQLLSDFKNTCICDHNIGNESKFNDLEIIYNTIKADECLHRQQMEDQLKAVDETPADITFATKHTIKPLIKREINVLSGSEDNDYNPVDEEEYNEAFAEDINRSSDEYEAPKPLWKAKRGRPKIPVHLIRKRVRKSGFRSLKRSYVCEWEFCGRSYPQSDQLRAHVSAVHTKEKPFECPTCDRRFSTKSYLKAHQKYAQREGKVCADITPRRGGRDEDLTGRDFVCDQSDCTTAFKTLTLLNRHKATVHAVSRLYECSWPGCGQAYRWEQSLRNHQLVHTDGGEFCCDFADCTKSYPTVEDLKAHKRKHRRNARPGKYPCDWPGCQFSGKTKQDLTIHTNRHQNIKPFKCEMIGCGISYYTEYELKQHVIKKHEIHTESDKQYTCDIGECRRCYATERDLKRHKRRHDRIYRCSWPECDQSYAAKVLLQEHMDRHLNIKAFKCHFIGCDREFFTIRNCQKHMKNVHKVVKPSPTAPFNVSVDLLDVSFDQK